MNRGRAMQVRAARPGPLCVVLCIMLLAASCGRQVTIESVPTGAKVWINGDEAGTTPVTLDLASTSWFLAARRARLELPGFRPVEGSLDWEYDPYHLVFLAGIVLWPTQFIHLHPRLHRRLKARYRVVLEEDLDGGGALDERRLYGSNLDPEVQQEEARP